MNERRPTVVSLFCGLGGLDLGFHWEGYDLVWANDLEPAATRSYALNFRFEPTCGDIAKIPVEDIPDSDVIIGGPPCQSFSLVGKRAPDDPRGALVFRFLEIIRGKQPRVFVMENVSGLAASKIGNRRLTDHLVDAFQDLGYRVTKMELLATDYLVPQRRKRLVLVGARGFTPAIPDKRRFALDCYGVDIDSYDLSARAAIGDLGPCVKRGEMARYNDTTPSRFAALMREGGNGSFSLHESPRMSKTDSMIVRHIPPGGNYSNVPDEVATGRILKFKATGGRTTTYGRLDPGQPSYTINTYFRRPNVGCHFHYGELRLITPREAMRFQAFPDRIDIISTAQDKRNALIGNAVPPLMARAIAWGIRRQLESLSSSSPDGNRSEDLRSRDQVPLGQSGFLFEHTVTRPGDRVESFRRQSEARPRNRDYSDCGSTS